MAVNLGSCSGLALYGDDGRLKSYENRSFRGRRGMQRGVEGVLEHACDIEWLVSEGEPALAAVWERRAMRAGVRVQRVDAATWRRALEVPAVETRRATERLARRILDWASMPQPVVLAPEAAQAICVGLWAVHRLGWLQALPVGRAALRRVAQPGRPATLARVAHG